jgi:hypothetical protein
MSRSQVFDVACGLLCMVLDSEPEGVFDTSYALESNHRALGLTDNVRDLMSMTFMADPGAAVTQTVAMYRRLDNRLPVLQACQRALEVCENEFDVNSLMEMASRMERGLPIASHVVPETSSPLDNGSSQVTIKALGFDSVPTEAVRKKARKGAWYRPARPDVHFLASLVASINGFVFENEKGDFQIRTDLAAPERSEQDCVFSPPLKLQELLHFCGIARPHFDRMIKQQNAALAVGEPAVPSASFRTMLVGPTQKFH